MRSFIITSTLLASLSSHAQSDWFDSTFDLFKQSLPHSLNIHYDKSKINVGQDSHQAHYLNINKHFDSPFSIESKFVLNKDKTGSGPLSHRLKQYQIEFVPRYQLSSTFSLGMGVVYSSSPTLTPSHDTRYELGSETTFMMSGRINGFLSGHWMELGVAKKSRRSASLNDVDISLDRGFNENQFQFKYQGSF